MESINQESLKDRISRSIEQAKNNPISDERVIAIEWRLNEIKDKFVAEGHRTPEGEAEEMAIEAEIMQSSAVVDTLPGCQELFSQVARDFNLGQAWADDLVAHENAHANVAEATGHDLIGYAVLFIKDEGGQLSNLQPLHISRPDVEWGPRESLTKHIEVTNAPAEYGNTLSEGDKFDIEADRRRLAEIDRRDQIEQIRASLGMPKEDSDM